MSIHPDLICPHCAGSNDNLVESSFGGKVHCTKCKSRVFHHQLRCRLEKAVKPDLLNTRKGYNPYLAPTITEERRIRERITEHETRMHLAKQFLDIGDPGLKDRKFDNYTILKAL